VAMINRFLTDATIRKLGFELLDPTHWRKRIRELEEDGLGVTLILSRIHPGDSQYVAILEQTDTSGDEAGEAETVSLAGRILRTESEVAALLWGLTGKQQ
jgi:hypothetical protein